MISVWINGEQRDGIDGGWIARRVQGLRLEARHLRAIRVRHGDKVMTR